jgi:hypothetical protein
LERRQRLFVLACNDPISSTSCRGAALVALKLPTHGQGRDQAVLMTLGGEEGGGGPVVVLPGGGAGP